MRERGSTHAGGATCHNKTCLADHCGGFILADVTLLLRRRHHYARTWNGRGSVGRFTRRGVCFFYEVFEANCKFQEEVHLITRTVCAWGVANEVIELRVVQQAHRGGVYQHPHLFGGLGQCVYETPSARRCILCSCGCPSSKRLGLDYAPACAAHAQTRSILVAPCCSPSVQTVSSTQVGAVGYPQTQ